MSELMVVAYADRSRALEVLDTLRYLDDMWMVGNEVAAVVRDKKGKLRIPKQIQPLRGREVPWSTLWRGLLQKYVPPAIREQSTGTGSGGAVGIPDRFVWAAGQTIERGDSALVIWARDPLPPPLHQCLADSGGELLRESLSVGQDALLESVLDVLGPPAEQSGNRAGS